MNINVTIEDKDILALDELLALSRMRYWEIMDAMPDDPYEWSSELEDRLSVWSVRIQLLERIRSAVDEYRKDAIRNEVIEWRSNGQG